MYIRLNEASSLSLKARIAIKRYCESTNKSDRSWSDFSSKNPGFTEDEYKEGLTLFGNLKPVDKVSGIKEVPAPTKPKVSSEPPKNNKPEIKKPEIKPESIKEAPKEAPKDEPKNELIVDGFKLSTNKIFKITVPYVKRRYEEFNKKYFNDELPILPVKLNASKRAAGSYGYTSYRSDPYRVENEHINVSTFYDTNEFNFCNTILHEMIHVYQINVLKLSTREMRRWAYSHGYTFTSKMNMINKFGWKIDTRVTEEERAEMTASPEQIRKLKNSNRIMVYVSNRFLACIPRNKVAYYKMCYSSSHLKFFDILDAAPFIDYPMCKSALRGRGMTPSKLQSLVDDKILSPIDALNESTHNYHSRPQDELNVVDGADALLISTDGDKEEWILA